MNDAIPNFDDYDVDEYEEVQEALADYEESAARLLDAVARRDEMVALLKIAQPSKRAAVRQCIADCNDVIERTENSLEYHTAHVESARRMVRHYLKLGALCDFLEPQLIAHVAENNPEKLELLEAMLSDDSKTH